MARFRKLKKELAQLLSSDNWREQLLSMSANPGILANPLLTLRLNRDELVCWRAAEGLGMVAAHLAETNMEKARTLMRVFMWFMNEESGNLGWAIPEAMACAMTLNEKLAQEYHTILASYIYSDKDCNGNYLDHPELRRGVYWGLGRLAKHRPSLVQHATRFLEQGCSDQDAHNRGLAARTIGILAQKGSPIPQSTQKAVTALTTDTTPMRIYQDDHMKNTTVGTLAIKALSRLS